MKSVETEHIMKELREEILGLDYEESGLSFDDIPIITKQQLLKTTVNFGELDGSLSFINSGWDISPFCRLNGKGIKLFIKKVVRKIVRPSFVQNLCAQREFNMHVIRSLNQMNLYIRHLEARIAELEKKEAAQ